MFYFVAGAKNDKICIAYEGKEWCFTLDKTSEFGNKFYSLLENGKSLTARTKPHVEYAESFLDPDDFNLSESLPQSQTKCKAGEILLFTGGDEFSLNIFVSEMDNCPGSKVGELEESSLEDFKSFLQGDFPDYLYFPFSIKEPEPLDPKIIVNVIIWLLLLLPLLFLVYYTFK